MPLKKTTKYNIIAAMVMFALLSGLFLVLHLNIDLKARLRIAEESVRVLEEDKKELVLQHQEDSVFIANAVTEILENKTNSEKKSK